MYNALTGIGGSGQVDPTVAANATVALLSAMAVTSLLIVGPVFNQFGPRVCLLLGGWAYPLYSGSLLCFNSMFHFETWRSMQELTEIENGNGAFVIVAGAILGIGASFVWVSQGAIMTTYVPEHQKGRAIALFWVTFNLGGGLGSLASFGLNYRSTTGTVSDATYISLLVVMAIGWLLGVLICPPSSVRNHGTVVETRQESPAKLLNVCLKMASDWRVLCMIPLFFSANVFYSYQQNEVNGSNFNIRTRSLNGALYWLAQMVGGLVMGMLLDLPKVSRPQRARIGWIFLFTTGMCIWGGGYSFQKWSSHRINEQNLKQDIDFTWTSSSVGPMFLYIFYGAYDAFWQSFCYWLIGAQSNSATVTAVLVGAYKAFQSVGGAMAWRINALEVSPTIQFFMDWGLCMGSLVLAIPTVLAVTLTSADRNTAGTEEKDQSSSTTQTS
jgi:MFS family permease